MGDSVRNMGDFRERLAAALSLAREGQTSVAINVLEGAVSDAIASKDYKWISLVGINLAILCRHSGRLSEGVQYLHWIIDSNPDDRTALYQLGELLTQSGEHEAANSAFGRSFELSLAAHDDRLLDLLEWHGFSRRSP